MATYIVTYDLHKQGQNYECVHAKLKSYPAHWHMQGSVWLIESSKHAVDVRDELAACLDSNDRLFVAMLEGEAAWHGYSSNAGNWIKARLEAA